MSIFAAFAIWVLLCLHAIIIFYEESEYSNITKFFGSFNPVVHFGHAIFDIRNFENFDGMHWSLLWEPFSPENTYLFGYHILLYLCNNTMLFILSNYIEAVNPFGYGIPQPLYYFVLPSYWFPSYFQKISDECIGEDTQLESKSHDKENKTQSNNIVSLEEYEIDEPSIVIKNLTKVYEFTLLSKIKNFIFGSSKRKNSLTNVNLKLYDNKLSVILGHNGAGKTTIFSILCGMITPTSGTVIINGYDIRKNIDEIRKTFGFCPQHNILIDEFTGSNFDEEEAMRLLKDLKMDFKVNCYARKLSGGQKRKLCLIIALIGDSKFVILDEPSSGLDPGARHDIWSLIIKEKKNRTILLTTHYMEEADVLGDKICILAKGELLCAGSSMLLKNTYGKGYEITIIFNKLVVAKDIMKENVDILLQYFKTFFPDVEYASSFGEEAKFIVNRKYKKEFGKFFKSLEKEVFLKVNEMNKIKNEEDIKTVENKEPLNKNLNDLKNIEKSRNGLSYLVKQFKALFIKRSIFVYRNFGCIFIGIIIPLLILLPFQNVVSLFKHSRTVLINYTPLNTGNLNYYKHTKERSYILFDRSQFGKDISEILKQSNSKMIEIFVPKDKSDSTPSLILYEMAKLKQRISLFYTPMGFSSYTKNVLDNETTIYKGFFNPMVIHSKPLVLNKIDIHILRKETGNNKLTITTINHPIPFNKQLYISKENGLGTIYSDIELRFRLQRYSILLSILLSSLTIFLLREKCSNSRKIQMLAGIKIWTYYLTTFIWDYLHYMIISFCMIISLKISGVEPLVKEATDILTLIFVIKLYGWSGISFNYLLHHMFNSVSQGFLVSLSINVITTIALEIIKLILGSKIKNLDNLYMVELLFSLIFPVHNINMCLFKLYKNGKERNECSVIDCSGKNSNFNKKCCGNAEEKIYVDNILINTSKRGLLPEVIILIFQGILYFSIVYGIENNFFKKHNPFKGKDNCDTDSCSTKDDDYKPKMEDDNFEDNDVKDVKKYVASEDPSNHSIVVSGVTKCYKKNKAVKGISFYVDQKQCFGLLGVNGAGKTSTFKMLSGECHYCKGDAYINGVDVKHEWNNIDSSIGYCPQIDAILMEMTCEEVLYMYGRIYGMSNEDLGYTAETIMNMLEIIIYRKKQIKNLSGGNKRKVSMAIAIISMPDILLLDEPTAGVDPIASRLVWNILSEIREYGSSIVLTTHSMNECEAICTSLAIMVYGKFKCYGSLQALKSKYGNQFNLLIKLKDLSMNENMIKKILEIFPGSILVENHSTKLHFKIPKKENTKYSELFENLESLVEPFKISDYTLSQTSLEEIFVEFSKSVE
uniref:ABC transporter domain-containing protein n=1 Tax=Parastrongyloides trichosuri TaxID=131310 RepID=A0A0N4ZQS1_PARTI